MNASVDLPVKVQEHNDHFLEMFHEDMRHVIATRIHLLDPLLKRSQNRQERPVQLDEKSYDIDGAQRVYIMLKHLISIGRAGIESFEIVMQAFVNRDRIRWRNRAAGLGDASWTLCAADQVEELWDLLIETGSSYEEIPDSMYDLILQAYANCATPRGDKRYALRAMNLYQRLESAHGERPASLVHVIHAYAWEQANMNEGQDQPALQAQVLLDRIECDLELVSRMQCYDWVLEAWSKSASVGSAENAQVIFDKMKVLNETLGGSDILDSEAYSNAILAWSKSNVPGSSRRGHQLLMELIEKYESGSLKEGEPPLIAFNGVITAFGREGRPDEAEQVLNLIQRIRPTCKTLTPDAVSYNSVIHAYLRSPLPSDQSLGKVLNLVRYMEDNSVEQPAISPNSFTYATVLKCWVRSGRDDSAEHADALLQKIDRAWKRGDRSVEPNNRVFNMVINAYAKSENRLAASRATELLAQMKASTLIRPDNISYTSVIECLSKSADPIAPQRAQDLLDELTELYRTTQDPSVMPNARTFTMAILAFSKNHGDAVQARRLLCRLTDLFGATNDPKLRPNEYPYNYVLNCAANAQSDQPRALAVATETFQEMRKSPLVQPDCFSYAFWIKCCNNLIPDGDLRIKCVSFAFEECRKGGLVSNEVLTRLFQGTPPRVVDQLLELPQGGMNYRTLSVQDLPPSWSRNAARERSPRR
jgi:pentatricopeptide repeat protein